MVNFVRNLGAAAGGVATGYIAGQEADHNRRQADAYKKLSEIIDQDNKMKADQAAQQQSERQALVGNRNPAAEAGAAIPGASGATELAGASGAAPVGTPDVPYPEGEAPAPAPVLTRPPFLPQRLLPRTLSNIYGNVGG